MHFTFLPRELLLTKRADTLDNEHVRGSLRNTRSYFRFVDDEAIQFDRDIDRSVSRFNNVNCLSFRRISLNYQKIFSLSNSSFRWYFTDQPGDGRLRSEPISFATKMGLQTSEKEGSERSPRMRDQSSREILRIPRFGTRGRFRS